MNDVFFSNSFKFYNLIFSNFHYTDNRSGSPSHYFAYMLKGRCKIVTKTQTVMIKEGDFFYIPYNCPYQSYWYGNEQISFISLGFRYMPNFDNLTYPVQTIPFSKKCAELFLKLSNTSPICASDIGTFYTLAGMLIPQMAHSKMCRSQEIVIQTKNYLVSHPNAKAKELAKNCAVSEAALYAAFKKASKTTPSEMKNGILLEKAKELLITGDKPIEYISDTLGFSSASYFRKKFKLYFGKTPSEMRKSAQI